MRGALFFLALLFFLATCSGGSVGDGSSGSEDGGEAATPVTSLCTGEELTRAESWIFEDAPTEDFHFVDLRIAENGSYLAAVGGYGVSLAINTLYLFSIESGTPLWSYEASDSLFDIDISDDGCYVAGGGGKVYLFSSTDQTATPLLAEQIGVSVFDAIDLSSDGSFLAAGDRFGQVVIYETKTLTQLAILDTEGDAIKDIAISDDSTTIFSGATTNLCAIDRATTTILWCFDLDRETIDVSVSSDGGLLAAETDQNVYVFSRESSTPLWQAAIDSFNTPHSVISEDGAFLSVVGNDRYLLYDATTGEVIWSFSLDGSQAWSSISSNGKFVAVGSNEYVYLFDRDWGEVTRPILILSESSPYYVTLSEDSSSLFYEGLLLQYTFLTPGILAELEDDVPVYRAGNDMNLRVFVSNPFQASELEIVVNLALPQVNFWTAESTELSDRAEGEVSKFLAEALEELSPGRREVLSETISVEGASSYDHTFEIEVPNLENPSWLDSFFQGIGSANIFSYTLDLVGDFFPDAIAGDIGEAFEELEQANPLGLYPLIGIGEVLLKEDDETISRDSFVFVYLVSFTF